MPSQAEIDVATQSLRKEGDIWLAQSQRMQALATKVAGLHRSRFEAGIFQITVDAYNELTEHVHDRCAEAVAVMADIGNTLKQVATVYEQEDQNQAHKFRNLY